VNDVLMFCNTGISERRNASRSGAEGSPKCMNIFLPATGLQKITWHVWYL
jgi:hypothetical protein